MNPNQNQQPQNQDQPRPQPVVFQQTITTSSQESQSSEVSPQAPDVQGQFPSTSQSVNSSQPAQAVMGQGPKSGSPHSVATEGAHISPVQRRAIIVIAVIFGLTLLLSGFGILLPLLIPLIIWYYRAYKRRESELKAFAVKNGFVLQGMTTLNDLDGVIFHEPSRIFGQAQSQAGYLLTWLVHGEVGGHRFRSYEYSLPGPDDNTPHDGGIWVSASNMNKTNNFLVMDLNVEGEGLQFLLVSKKQPTALNGLSIDLREYSLEGDFNDYFKLYAPEDAEIETLRIFTPDIMRELIENYQEYNIELTPQHLFLYKAAGSMSKTVGNLEKMLNDVRGLSQKFLKGIERVDFSKENVVRPELTAPANRSRIAKKFTLGPAILMSALVVGFVAGAIFLVAQDSKVPDGYRAAAEAKVSSSRANDNCRNSGQDCTPNYTVSIDYRTIEGQYYNYSEVTVNNLKAGSTVQTYYDPQDPVKVKTLGLNSSRIAIPVLVGSLILFLAFIWGVYFAQNRRKPSN